MGKKARGCLCEKACVLVGLFFSAFFFLLQGVWAQDFENVPQEIVENLYIRTEDGVDLKVAHLPRPNRPVLVLVPGLGAQGTSLELFADYFYNKAQYDVFVMNWRGSVELPSEKTILGTNNGLESITRRDFSAVLRHVYGQATPEQRVHGVSVLGHSMGGIQVMSTLSDDKLRTEMEPMLRGIVLFQSPHHLKYLKRPMKALAYLSLPLLSFLLKNSIRLIDHHSKVLEANQGLKKSGRFEKLLASTLESFFMTYLRFLISPSHSGGEEFRKKVVKMGAHGIPTELLLDFAKATHNGGEFFDDKGEKLIQPGHIRNVPIQLVRTSLDTLAPWKEQKEYFDELRSKYKQLLDIYELNHVDSLLSTKPEIRFLEPIAKFIEDPQREAIRTPHKKVYPFCESLLQRVFMKFRYRGI